MTEAEFINKKITELRLELPAHYVSRKEFYSKLYSDGILLGKEIGRLQATIQIYKGMGFIDEEATAQAELDALMES